MTNDSSREVSKKQRLRDRNRHISRQKSKRTYLQVNIYAQTYKWTRTDRQKKLRKEASCFVAIKMNKRTNT